MLRRQLRKLVRVIGEQLEERFELVPIPLKIRRKLPEDRPELLLQTKQTRRKEVRQRNFHIALAPHMSDVLTAFEREDEIFGRLIMPLLIAAWPLKRVERTVQFDRVK